MFKARLLAPLLALLLSASVLAQSPADALVAKVRSETGVVFTHSVLHQKTNSTYAVVVLLVKPKQQATDNAKVLGLLAKKRGKWMVADYVLGTGMHDAIKTMQKGHPQFPKNLYPKKI